MPVDTSVWIDHLRQGNARLVSLLGEGRVYCHPFVIAELGVGPPPVAAATTSPRGLGEEQRVRGQAPATSFGPRPLPAPSAACGGFLPR